MKISERIKPFDLFGFVPSFRIDGMDELKSFIGGMSTLIFLTLALTYFVYSIINFVDNLDNISTSRIVYLNSKNYTLTPVDIYFGIGILIENNTYINITNHPFFKIRAEYVLQNKLQGDETSNDISLVPCQSNLFIPLTDFNSFSFARRSTINKTLPSYLCLDLKSKFLLNPEYFSSNNYMLRFTVNLKNESNLTQAMDYISDLSPSLSFIFQDYLINSENKYKPYTQLIGEITNQVGFYFSKKIDIKINPSNILDDFNPIAQGNYSALNIPEYSSLEDRSIMMIERKADYFRFYPDREINPNANLNLINIEISLSNLFTSTLRTYRKFNDFVASVSTIISNVFLLFAIITRKLNMMKGINNMVKSSFSVNQVENLQIFKEKIRNAFDGFEYLKKRPNMKSRYVNKRFTGKYQTQTKKENKIPIVPPDNLTVHPSNPLIPPNITEIRLINEIPNRKDRGEIKNFESKLSLFQHIRMKYFCMKKKEDSLFQNAIKNVEKILDINCYLKFKLEMDLIKQVILDNHQKKVFDALSTMLNFNRLFDENYDENSTAFETFCEKDINEIIRPIKFISRRKKTLDLKILNIMKKLQ